MIENIQNYKWLLISSFFSAITIVLVKYYSNFKNNWLLILAVLSECGLIYSYVQILHYGDILTQFSLVKIIAILLVTVPSFLLAWTKLTISKAFGFIFGIIAIYLLK
jgi:hypothetical protein